MADDANIGGAHVKGQFSEGEEPEASPMVMAAVGWFRGLVLGLEPILNSDFHELDHIEIGVLHQECLVDLDAAGCHKSDLPKMPFWRKVRAEHFPQLRQRVHRAVDSKDKVRAELRRRVDCFAQRSTTQRKGARICVACVLLTTAPFDESAAFIRTDRLKPADAPLVYLTYIQDGTTQSFYKLPWYLDTETGDGVARSSSSLGTSSMAMHWFFIFCIRMCRTMQICAVTALTIRWRR